jgi:N-hydroxyarylamine O-acetyltransferase
MTVPFENLDIGVRPIRLDLGSLVAKVVDEHRGGYCYELNGLFAALLRSLGYAVELVSARVALPDGRLTPDFDHLALIVTSPQLQEPHLADVGFGDAFLEPIPLRDGFARSEGPKLVGVVEHDGGWAYREDHGEGWAVQYTFAHVPRALEDFAERNEWQQASPESHFTQKRVTSLATPTGRITLSDQRLIRTTAGARAEEELTSEQVVRVLEDTFGISLETASRPTP